MREFDPSAPEFADRIKALGPPADGKKWTVREVADATEASNVLVQSLIDGNPIYPVWRDEDVLDTWFSSASVAVLHARLAGQDAGVGALLSHRVLVTGFDIIFFWVARMMMLGMHFMGDVPFHDRLYPRAGARREGAKMSKSKGNVIDPLALIEQYGADAAALHVGGHGGPGARHQARHPRVEGYRNFATKLWNATRFLEMNECVRVEGFDPASVTQTLNRWIVTETARCVSDVSAALDGYRFNDAAGGVYRFVWNTFCDWYIELAKPALNGDDEAFKAETRATAAWAVDEILKVLHPFMPFITEELWQRTGETGPTRTGQLTLTAWPSLQVSDETAAGEINWLVDMITQIRSVRSESNVPAGAKVPLVMVGASAQTLARLDTHTAAIRQLARVETIETADSAPKGSAQIVVGEATVCLPLAGVIDFEGEKARLTKEIDKIDADIARIDKKLANPKFVEKAPEEVVAGEKEKRDDFVARRAKIEEALRRLNDAA